MGVLRLNRAAVENAQFVGELRAERFSGFGSDNGVGVGGHLRRCGLPGANGPDRLVGDHEAGGFLGRNFIEGAETLAAQNVVGETGFTFFEDLSDADDGNESGFEADLSLRLTLSSVSPKYWRRSECPMMTWVTPTETSMAALISPV